MWKYMSWQSKTQRWYVTIIHIDMLNNKDCSLEVAANAAACASCILCWKSTKLEDSDFCSQTCQSLADVRAPFLIEIPRGHVSFKIGTYPPHIFAPKKSRKSWMLQSQNTLHQGGKHQTHTTALVSKESIWLWWSQVSRRVSRDIGE
jgi:hypothetical protein